MSSVIAVSKLNGSAPLMVNPFANRSVPVSSRAKERRAALENSRSAGHIASVDRVASVVVDMNGIIIGMHTYTFDGKPTTKVQLLIHDPTACYTGDEDQFKAKTGKNGEVSPAEIRIDKVAHTLGLPIGKTSTFDETFGKWQAKGKKLVHPGEFYEFRKARVVDAKLALTSPGEEPKLYMPVRVGMSVFAFLPGAEPDPKKPDAAVREPDGVTISVRIHTMKPLGRPNPYILAQLFAQNPHLTSQPVLSYAEYKKIDVDLTNKGKGDKPKMVGSLIVTVPCLCGVEPLEAAFLELENSSLGSIELRIAGDKNATVYQRKDGTTDQVIDAVINVDQIRGDGAPTKHIISTRLWSDALSLYGCSDVGIWTLGMSMALVKQTPAFISGVIDHTESAQHVCPEGVESSMAIVAQQPVFDLVGAIANLFGIPVTAHFARHMSVLAKRAGAGAPAPHPLFRSGDPTTFKKNFYNNSSGSPMIVLNELEPQAREAIFKDTDSDYVFFVVVGGRVLKEREWAILAQLRELQQDPNYKGPLGEMLAHQNWDPTKPAQWTTSVYGSGATAPECTVPADHIAVKKEIGPFAMSAYFYIYAVSRKSYNDVMSTSGNQMLTIEATPESVGAGAKRTERSADDDDNNDDDDDEPASKAPRTME